MLRSTEVGQQRCLNLLAPECLKKDIKEHVMHLFEESSFEILLQYLISFTFDLGPTIEKVFDIL